jgi:hypothetical protein
MDDIFVDGVLYVGSGIRRAEHALRIGLVLGEQQLSVSLAIQVALPIVQVVEGDAEPVARAHAPAQARLGLGAVPGPHVTKPNGRQQLKPGWLGAAVGDGDGDQHIFGTRLRILHEHVEVAVLREHPGVDEFILRFADPALPVLSDQTLVGKLALGVFVQILHVRMGRGVVEIKIALFDIFAMIAFVVGESEQPFFQYRVAPIPQRDGKADVLMAITDAGQAVFVPTVRPRAGMIVREVLPGCARGTVIFAHGAPRAFTQIRAPAIPVLSTSIGCAQPFALFCMSGL